MSAAQVVIKGEFSSKTKVFTLTLTKQKRSSAAVAAADAEKDVLTIWLEPTSEATDGCLWRCVLSEMDHFKASKRLLDIENGFC